jgi:NAD(P)-dependent dehydrogenase (short-subunit alcohol dehydrogenase family)
MNALKDKIALITGGTSGMGAATAKRFHEEGATVIVTGSSKASVEAARQGNALRRGHRLGCW